MRKIHKIEDVMTWNVKASIKPNERLLLYKMIKEHRPEYVLETGSGASTVCILLALRENEFGTLTSIDKPDFDGCRKRGGSNKIRKLWENLKMHYPDWTVHEEDIVEKLPLVVDEIPHIDFFLDDSFHTSEHVFFEFDLIIHKLSKGGIFAMHDVGAAKLQSFVKALDDNPEFESLERVRALKFWRRK